jgi:hypothetical protein
MGFSLNGKDIKELYYGNVKISEAWLNGQKVYSSVPLVSGINYMFRDIDANGKLTLATGELEDASEITSIGDNGLRYVFYHCEGVTGVFFPNLTSIGTQGLRYGFNNCTGLRGSVSFPNLTSIDSNGLNKVFNGCNGITEVHFKSSLSGNSECTTSNMGCTNATVYFDL